jgi:hypothetical protein
VSVSNQEKEKDCLYILSSRHHSILPCISGFKFLEIDSTDKSPTQRMGRKQSSLHGNFSTLSLTPKRVPEQPSSLSPPPTPMVRNKCRRRIFMGATAGSPVCRALFASSTAIDDDDTNINEKTPTPKRVLKQPSSVM